MRPMFSRSNSGFSGQWSRAAVNALFGVIFIAGVAIPALAQAPPPTDADDQTHGVARISIMDGQVSVRRGDAGEWVAGVINAPLMADDTVATGPNSRGEVQFDASNMLRIGGNAEVHLTALEAERYQMELAKGTVTFRVLRPSNINIEVDTPSVSVRPSKVGVYRINVNDAGETQVVSRAGDVEVFTPKGSQWVSAGQMMLARGSASDPEFQIENAIPVDAWDQWNQSRDQVFLTPAAQASDQYVPQGVYGAEDLGQNGTWRDVPQYGQVWQPTVAAGWSPYSCGRWVWEDWYGWTWVGCESWGWAPYHYGRWFYEANYGGWLWYPGVRGYRHGWSPALVGFFGWGGGGGFGVNFGFGNIGWVPLAPYEVFHPWWGRGFYGRGFENRINITNVNIYNNYRNARVLNGVSGMRAGDFTAGRFNGLVHPGGAEIRSAGMVHGQMPFGPSRGNLAFSEHAASFTPRGGAASNRFFTHQSAPAVQHMEVTRGFAASNRAGGAASGQTRGGFGQSGAATESRGFERSGGGAGGSRTFGSGAGAVNDRPATAARPGQNGASGWGHFNGSGAAPGRSEGTANGNRGESAPAGIGRNESPAVRGGQQAPSVQNSRPGGSNGGWNHFGEPGSGGGRTVGNGNGGRAPSAPQGEGRSQNYAPSRSYGAPQGGGQRSFSPPVVRERQSAPSYSAPRQNSAPSYSAPRGGGGGGGGAPRGGGAPARSGGGGHPGGGGGGHRR